MIDSEFWDRFRALVRRQIERRYQTYCLPCFAVDKYTVYGRHLQANVGQCRNGDDEPQTISFAVIITITQGLTKGTH